MIKEIISDERKIRILFLGLLVVLAFIAVVILVNNADQDRKEIVLQETVESACEWPCTKEDRMTAGAWFATLDAENTLQAQSIALTETPAP